MKVENAKSPGAGAWMVFDAHERAYVWECQTQRNARKFADAGNEKERLRTAKIASVAPNIEDAPTSPARGTTR